MAWRPRLFSCAGTVFYQLNHALEAREVNEIETVVCLPGMTRSSLETGRKDVRFLCPADLPASYPPGCPPRYPSRRCLLTPLHKASVHPPTHPPPTHPHPGTSLHSSDPLLRPPTKPPLVQHGCSHAFTHRPSHPCIYLALTLRCVPSVVLGTRVLGVSKKPAVSTH